MNQVKKVLTLTNSQADTLKFYKNLVNFMSKTPAKQRNQVKQQVKQQERRKKKYDEIIKPTLEYYTLNVLIFRNDNDRPGKPDFERNGNKFWLLSNYKEGQARRDYIDIEVFGPHPFPNELFKKYILRDDANDIIKYNQIMEILLTNDEFTEYTRKSRDYIGAVYIKSVEQIPKTNKKYNVEQQKLKDTTHSSISYKYIETNVDMSFNTLKEAIENKKYIKDECWLNSIYDFYKDTLLKEKKEIT